MIHTRFIENENAVEDRAHIQKSIKQFNFDEKLAKGPMDTGATGRPKGKLAQFMKFEPIKP